MADVFHVSGPVAVGRGSLTDYTSTTNPLVDVGAVPTQGYKTVRFQFSATTQNMRAIILGSIDGGTTYPNTVVAEFAVNVAGGPTLQTVSTYFTTLKVQGKPAVNDVHGTLATLWAGANF